MYNNNNASNSLSYANIVRYSQNLENINNLIFDEMKKSMENLTNQLVILLKF